MTSYASHMAAVPGPVLPLLLVAALGCVWLATRAWNQPPTHPGMVECPCGARVRPMLLMARSGWFYPAHDTAPKPKTRLEKIGRVLATGGLSLLTDNAAARCRRHRPRTHTMNAARITTRCQYLMRPSQASSPRHKEGD